MQNNCVSCGYLCSTSAKFCPKCGHPNPTEPLKTLTEQVENKTTNIIISICGLMFLAWIFAPQNKFYFLFALGFLSILLVTIYGFLAKSAINWKRSLINLSIIPFLILAYSSYQSHNYLQMFLGILLAAPGIVFLYKYGDIKDK
jgi:4-hydroxybenzoate polyprenyltransferase